MLGFTQETFVILKFPSETEEAMEEVKYRCLRHYPTPLPLYLLTLLSVFCIGIHVTRVL